MLVEGTEHRTGKSEVGGRMEASNKQEGALQLGIGLLDHILHCIDKQVVCNYEMGRQTLW